MNLMKLMFLGQERQVQHCEEGSHGGSMQLGQARRITGGKRGKANAEMSSELVGWPANTQNLEETCASFRTRAHERLSRHFPLFLAPTSISLAGIGETNMTKYNEQRTTHVSKISKDQVANLSTVPTCPSLSFGSAVVAAVPCPTCAQCGVISMSAAQLVRKFSSSADGMVPNSEN